MSISFTVPGEAGRDNALLVRVDSGHAVDHLLFDCGEGCLRGLSLGEIQSIDHLFFSHLHMDHVAGFDSFFRATYNRTTRPNHIWGPPLTAEIIGHRFRGFIWNLHEEMEGTWRVSDIHPDRIETSRFELAEAFATPHPEQARLYQGVVLETGNWSVEAVTMDHKTPSIAYIVREKPHQNIDTERLAALGLRPGPWLKRVKAGASGVVMVEGVEWELERLRGELIVETEGDSIAYLTDFILDAPAIETLSAVLTGCRTVVCEGQYRHADLELAERNHHMTTVQAATLAARAGVERLILFHLSERYRAGEWMEMLEEARQIFPNTAYPEHWQVVEEARSEK